MYRHIRNYYLSNSKTFQDGNGNGNFGKINSNDFQDGNLGINGNEGVTADTKTVTVIWKFTRISTTGNGNGNLGKINSQE